MIYFGKNMGFISEKKTKCRTPVEDPFDVSSDLLLQAADAKSGAVTVATWHRRQSASLALAISLAIYFSVWLYKREDKSRVSDAQQIALILSI